jgi:hypothetical protein
MRWSVIEGKLERHEYWDFQAFKVGMVLIQMLNYVSFSSLVPPLPVAVFVTVSGRAGHPGESVIVDWVDHKPERNPCISRISPLDTLYIYFSPTSGPDGKYTM